MQNQANWIKALIRSGIRLVPNHLLAYRLCAQLGEWLVRPPRGIQWDGSKVAHVPVVWLNHRHHCSSRVILYLHGGGYVIGSNGTHVELASRIARSSRAQVIMAEYRLAPEHPYPAALEDAFLIYEYLLAQRIDPSRIILAGDSAGGGLTVALLQYIRQRQRPMPAGAVCLSPWLDLSCSLSASSYERVRDPLISPERIRFFARHYAGEADLCQPGLSPLYGDLAGLPPILIQVGTHEILLEECQLFSDKARGQACSVTLDIWPGMFHVWHFAAQVLPEARAAIQRIGQFVRDMVPAGSSPSSLGDQ